MPYAGHGIGARRRHHHGGAGATVTASVDMFAATGTTSANISLPSNSVLAQATYGTLTLEAWVKLSTVTPATWCTLIGFGTSGDQIDLAYGSDNVFHAFGGGGANGPAISANTWTHVAFVTSVAGTFSRWLINGVQQGTDSGTNSFTLNTTPRFLGGDGGTEACRGRISDLRVWNVARTTPQILANYNKRLVGNEAGLAGYWKLNENSGVTVADSTAGAATGTFSSATDIKWVADMPTFV